MALLKKASGKLYQSIPVTTGVYQFLDKTKKPIYIGKANNLRVRIKQHFTNKENNKEKLITKNTVYIKLWETGSEFQALILEANQIRQFLPKYNAILLDDKSRLYIVITKGDYPKIALVRKRDLIKNNYLFVFGPMNSKNFTRQFLHKIRQAIPFCTEPRINPKPCFYSQIGLCSPCPNYIETQNKGQRAILKRKYQNNIKRIVRLLSGDGTKILASYQKDLKKHALRQEYEQAAYIRDKVAYLEHLFAKKLIFDSSLNDYNYIQGINDRQNNELKTVLKLPKLERVECYDVSNLNFKEATASMVVFNKAEAQPENYRRFKIRNRRVFDPEMLLEVLQRRFKHPEWPTPNLIVIDGGSPQILKIVPKIKNPKTPMIIGLAKKPDRIILPSLSTLVLKPDSLALNYLQKMRDEAHRFAKKYHLYLRQKVLLELKDRVK